MLTEQQQTKLNDLQEDLNDARDRGVPLGTINDGAHSFNELYRHRMVLFIGLCKQLKKFTYTDIWMSRMQSDGTAVQEGWFILGIDKKPGRQITYHLPMSDWDECKKIAKELAKAPEYDGHTTADVLTRLAAL